ncbi:tRNA glutamyl-Q(34) synthetase GluQRS [Desulfuromonas sp. TF]|uniref:tRNA glutamyl-Q(34) synthetase GluQRS n=1 Tax=Desulfuromonas sp. TF TaxID=1232410 RepID=UPI0012DF941A|nr:tRNA glutamyl-Q(34) synthetase GluQRS [Desulfuromonas sp. TF]
MYPDDQMRHVTGRFAPSPTGPLHVGSLVAAVGSYCLARRSGGRWLVRMEDLDAPRIVPGAAEQILRTLEVLGLEWDGAVVWQSRRKERYEAAMQRLREKGLVFDCACSRREVLASAPHSGEEGPVYPGTCRQGIPRGRRPRALRLRVPEEMFCFSDGVFGRVEQHLASAVGDFVLRRADGLFAYQLAVVVDDADAGVNQVVRGADLLASTPRQIFLHCALGTEVPGYIHLPLVLTADGEKLSKRHGAVSVGTAGQAGMLLWRVLAFLGQEPPASLHAAPAREVLAWGTAHFDPSRVSRQPRQWGTTGGDRDG